MPKLFGKSITARKKAILEIFVGLLVLCIVGGVNILLGSKILGSIFSLLGLASIVLGIYELIRGRTLTESSHLHAETVRKSREKEKTLATPTISAPAPVPTLQLTEEQIEQKISSIRKSLESGAEPEFSQPTPQDRGTAVCIGCNKPASKQELFYCKKQDYYMHQRQECFDKLNSKIEGAP